VTGVSSVRHDAVASVAASGGPTRGDDPLFAEPWEGRAFALAIETVDRLRLPWDSFRRRLIVAIAEAPDRPYYESWLVAVERLVLDHHAAGPADLATHRMRAASYRVDEAGLGDVEIFPIAVTEARMLGTLDRLFTHWWPNMRFGPIIQGAVYELRAPHRPELSMLDGYLTIGFDGWHVHLCIGEHIGTPGHPVAPDVARVRRCTYAELARSWVDGTPVSWMFRMYNGAGEQQLTVLLPNPFLDDDQRALPEPDWTRLDCWDELRRSLLELDPDPRDRSGVRFIHS
jgi:nitrile hydratase accessory protein